MSETVLIILPLPPPCLSSNHQSGSAGGRMKRARVARHYRALARDAVVAAGVESAPWHRATISARFLHKTRRRRDDVNHLGMLKPAYDGLVDGGLLVDDDSEHLSTLCCEFGLDKLHPRVELWLERLE